MATPASGYKGAQRSSILASAVVGYALDSYNLLILTFALPSIGKSLGLSAGLVAGTLIASQGPDGWRWALASGFLPVVVCIAIRFAMPESRLWMPTMIVDSFHQKPPVWSNVNTYAVWVVIPVKIAFGAFSDRLGRKFAALGPVVFMLVASAGYLAISTSGFSQPYTGSIWTWSVFWIFFVWSAGNAATSSIGAWLSEMFPTRARATAISTAYMLGRGLGGFAPIFVPLLAGGNWARGMGIVSLAGCVAFVVAGVLLPETRNRVLRAAETAGDSVPQGGLPPVVEPA